MPSAVNSPRKVRRGHRHDMTPPCSPRFSSKAQMHIYSIGRRPKRPAPMGRCHLPLTRIVKDPFPNPFPARISPSTEEKLKLKKIPSSFSGDRLSSINGCQTTAVNQPLAPMPSWETQNLTPIAKPVNTLPEKNSWNIKPGRGAGRRRDDDHACSVFLSMSTEPASGPAAKKSVRVGRAAGQVSGPLLLASITAPAPVDSVPPAARDARSLADDH